ncbi:phage tail protein [Collimonas fungivorans]|uniref:Phage P2 GpU n=1 Tax=Collimonas fungivorans (strain Ter331) TaxID=1005048 RepID=G0AIR7_COLFT|nr:phage tail protein [Collimonas fungivorans]AEK60850.1 Phage P2 GpU [Collimonas fungivorans Ter331]
MMMALGMFVFSLPTLAYQDLQRQTEWKHPSSARVGTRDAHQYTGKGDDTITLTGWIAPELTGSLYSLDALRLMADTGKSWILIQGTGRIYGSFVITSMTEGRTVLAKNGDAGRVDFAVTLKRTDESVLTMASGLMGMAGGLMGKLGDIGSIKSMLSLDAIGKSLKDTVTSQLTVGNIVKVVKGKF